MIIAGTIEVFLNHFARGMDPFASVMAPRYYHQVPYYTTDVFSESFCYISFHNVSYCISNDLK